MLQIDQYAYTNAFRNVHPVEKAVFVILFLMFSLLTKKVSVAIFTFILMSVAIVIGAKIPLSYYVKILLYPFFFLFTSVLVMIISIVPKGLVPSDFVMTIPMGAWQLYVGQTNLLLVKQLFFTVIASISCMYFFILTTPIQQIAWLFQKLRIPHLFTELFLFTYRFIFMLLDKVAEIRLAQTSRHGYETFRNTFFSLGRLIISLLATSLRSANELDVALASRGGSGHFFGVELTESYKMSHWLFLTTSFFFLTLLTICI